METEQTDSDNKSLDLQEEALAEFKRGPSKSDLKPYEEKIYTALFQNISDRYSITEPEDIMMLDRALYNYILASRGSSYLARMGMIVTDSLKSGDVTKINPVMQGVANADKRFMEFMDKLKLSRHKRDSGEMSADERRDMKIVLSRLKKVTDLKESIVGASTYTVIECTPENPKTDPEKDGPIKTE